jgi:hypothetical protein
MMHLALPQLMLVPLCVDVDCDANAGLLSLM